MQTECKTALTTSRGRDTFRKYASHSHRREKEDAYLTAPDIDAFPLTCSVDHALGCRCRSSENVGGAAGGGRAAGGGCAHRIDGQAAGWRLFNWNHNTPVTNETPGHQQRFLTRSTSLVPGLWVCVCVVMSLHSSEQLGGLMYSTLVRICFVFQFYFCICNSCFVKHCHHVQALEL